MSKFHREREIESGLPPSFPPLPPRRGQCAATHQCGSCDKKFTKISGLEAHLRRKSHIAKDGEVLDGAKDTYYDPEGFDEHGDTEMQSIPRLQNIPHQSIDRLRQALEGSEKTDKTNI